MSWDLNKGSMPYIIILYIIMFEKMRVRYQFIFTRKPPENPSEKLFDNFCVSHIA